MELVEAIYQGGVFKPLSDVPLKENQRVRLRVESIESGDLHAWMERFVDSIKR